MDIIINSSFEPFDMDTNKYYNFKNIIEIYYNESLLLSCLYFHFLLHKFPYTIDNSRLA